MTPLAAYLLLFTVVGIGFIFVHLIAGKLIRPNKPDVEKGTIYECGEPTIGTAWVQFDLRFYVVALLFVVFDVEVAFFFPWAEVFGKANAIALAEKPTTAEEYVAYAEKVQDLALPTTEGSRLAAKRYEEVTGRASDGKPILDEDGKPVGPLTAEKLAAMVEAQKAAQDKLAKKEKLTPQEEAALGREGPFKSGDFQSAARGEEIQKKVQAAKQKQAKGEELTEEERAVLEFTSATRGGTGSGEFEKNRDNASSLAWLALVEILVFFCVLLVGFAYLWKRGDLEWVRSTAAERLEARGVRPPAPPAQAAPQPRETVGAH